MNIEPVLMLLCSKAILLSMFWSWNVACAQGDNSWENLYLEWRTSSTAVLPAGKGLHVASADGLMEAKKLIDTPIGRKLISLQSETLETAMLTHLQVRDNISYDHLCFSIIICIRHKWLKGDWNRRDIESICPRGAFGLREEVIKRMMVPSEAKPRPAKP